jgi:hypothetical protein
LIPDAWLVKEAGGRLTLVRIGLVALFLALHSNQEAISGSDLSPKNSITFLKIT